MRLNANSWIIRFTNAVHKNWWDKIEPGQTDSCTIISAFLSAILKVLGNLCLVLLCVVVCVMLGMFLIEFVHTAYQLSVHGGVYDFDDLYVFNGALAIGTFLFLCVAGGVLAVGTAIFGVVLAFDAKATKQTAKFVVTAIASKAKKFCFPVEVYKEDK